MSHAPLTGSDVSLKDLLAFCRSFVAHLKPRQLVLLSGPLGAGKTQFVKSCVEALHGTGNARVESPTFSIINEYEGTPNIYHVDLYRLETAADIESTGFWDLFSGEGLIFVEWPEQTQEADFPKYWDKIKIELALTADAQVRKIKIT